MTEPIELTLIRQTLAYARQDFANDVDGLLIELRLFSDSLGNAIGEVSREEALRALRRFVLEKFDQRLAVRQVDPMLLQLVREAYDHLQNPESPVDIKEWVKTAEPFVRS